MKKFLKALSTMLAVAMLVTLMAPAVYADDGSRVTVSTPTWSSDYEGWGNEEAARENKIVIYTDEFPVRVYLEKNVATAKYTYDSYGTKVAHAKDIHVSNDTVVAFLLTFGISSFFTPLFNDEVYAVIEIKPKTTTATKTTPKATSAPTPEEKQGLENFKATPESANTQETSAPEPTLSPITIVEEAFSQEEDIARYLSGKWDGRMYLTEDYAISAFIEQRIYYRSEQGGSTECSLDYPGELDKIIYCLNSTATYVQDGSDLQRWVEGEMTKSWKVDSKVTFVYETANAHIVVQYEDGKKDRFQ